VKNDNQHLDFLISQYVDGTLDAANRKLIEQQLAASPEARALLKSHRETQDVLDDYGSRIPLINWDEFDKKLATRLEHESLAEQRGKAFRHWMRPMAAAAALFIATGMGYAWHAWSGVATTSGTNPPAVVHLAPVTPVKFVQIDDRPETNPSHTSVALEGPNNTPRTNGNVVVSGEGPPVLHAAVVNNGAVTASATRPDSSDPPQ